MTSPVILTDALPMVESDGETGRNNGHDYRKGLLSSILMPNATSVDPLVVRTGVFPHNRDAAGCTSLRVDQTSSASQSLKLNPGAFVCERSGQGPYIGWEETTAGVTIPMPSSDGTFPRIDVIYVHVMEQASIVTDSDTNAYVQVLQGTAQNSPTAPIGVPDGAEVICEVARAAGSTGNTITKANLTDRRKAAGLLGAVRALLPGDSLSDPGQAPGEMRYREAVSPLPALVDYWDGTNWRGTQNIALSTTISGTVQPGNIIDYSPPDLGYASASNHLLPVVTVPDPGWPYRLRATFSMQVVTAASTVVNCYISTSAGGGFASQIVTVAGTENISLVQNGANIHTGTITTQINMDRIQGTGKYGFKTDARNQFNLEIIPA